MEDSSFSGFKAGRELIQSWALGEPVEVSEQSLGGALRVIGVLLPALAHEGIHALTDEDQELYKQLGAVTDTVGHFLENSHEHGTESHLAKLVGYVRYTDFRCSWDFLGRLSAHPACTDQVLSRAVVYGWYASNPIIHMHSLNRLVKKSGLGVKVAAFLSMHGHGRAMGSHSYAMDMTEEVVKLGEAGAETFMRLFADLTEEGWEPESRFKAADRLIPPPMARLNRALALAQELSMVP